ncbi:DUF494 family protein [Legionella dresdenensis]|uniref:DUF494 family protein n=1 Tax=Legionella dresdenensis TaxID=450200 RepID=A0ABV8CF87_9GAMM
MKDSLFEMLMSFFEKSLSQLTESNAEAEAVADNAQDSNEQETIGIDNKTVILRPAAETATRVFTCDEKHKFTKASYQFIARMMQWNIVSSETMEQIINQLLFSESRYVTLEETKWTIRNILADKMDSNQLAFLDLVLYQKEDQFALH